MLIYKSLENRFVFFFLKNYIKTYIYLTVNKKNTETYKNSSDSYFIQLSYREKH